MQEIANLGTGAFFFWSTLLILLSLAALYFSFYHLHRARLIEDTPTSRIRSAPQGYVELIGEADMMKGEPVISPLSATQCCWWRYKVDRKDDKGWHAVRSEKSNALFLIKDETGECILDPEGAQSPPVNAISGMAPTQPPQQALTGGSAPPIASSTALDCRYRSTPHSTGTIDTARS
ncbi:MAG: hypothetical protein N0E43_16860 [Candidatus Thiodiazotropha lotti]|nr:hypothetical protein [Candidatus Thiodiazotropha lotti]